MPIVKLRLLSLTVATARVIVEALRRGGPVLLLPFGLVMLLQWGGSYLPASSKSYSDTSLLSRACEGLTSWMMVLIVARASLGGRSGLDLLRPDRLTFMLLGLQACLILITNLIPTPRGVGLQAVTGVAMLIFHLAWLRATLLLSVSWALGIDMTPAGSWIGLKGNFLRTLGFGLVWMLFLIVVMLACTYGVNGSFRLPSPKLRPVPWSILFGLSAVIIEAVPCAIYGQLTSRPSPPTEPESIAA